MTQLPLRARLTAVFIVVMAVVLGVVGAAVYFETKHNIDSSIAQSLRTRQGALHDFAADPPRRAISLIPAGERYAQLERPDGSVIESRPPADPPMLSRVQLRQALRHPGVFERHEQVRYFAGLVRIRGRPAIAVVATSLAQHEQALEGLSAGLLIGGAVALTTAAAIAYAVAAAALRPIEAMRRRAASIRDANLDARLPVPPVDDEVRRLAVTLNEMLERMATAAAAERRLVANASHELRTPLAALQADLELALRPGTGRHELRETVERVREDAARLIALGNSLLDLSRQEEQQHRPWQTVPVAGLFELASRAFAARAEAEGRRIVVQPTAAVVHGEPDDLLRAVANLVENALVHGRGVVRLSARETVAGAVLQIDDEGELSADTAATAFERFARGPEASDRPGAGLGLALVRAIARQHGGEATLDSFDGGVRAEIQLPKTPPA